MSEEFTAAEKAKWNIRAQLINVCEKCLASTKKRPDCRMCPIQRFLGCD